MFVLQEGYSISENGRDFLGAVTRILILFYLKTETFSSFSKWRRKIMNRVHSWIIFAFHLGRKRISDRKFYHLWWEHAHLVESKSAICSLAITLDPTPGRNRFQKPPFTSIHTSKAKRPRFQKSAPWRAFVKRSVVSVLELTGYARTVGKQGGKKISSSDKYKDIPGSCLMRLLLILCTSVYKIATVFNFFAPLAFVWTEVKYKLSHVCCPLGNQL